jgi:arabinogalactan oligomer/maltooligosaccharide transport system permease protein
MGGTMGNVWLMKGFFDSIPHEIDEAAEIDGAGHVTIFVKVLLPLVTPILAVNFLLTFIHVIGEYMLAAIFLTDDKVKTLAVGLYGIIEGDQSGNLGLFCAGSILLCIPVVLLFLYLQKYITSGMTAGAVKS